MHTQYIYLLAANAISTAVLASPVALELTVDFGGELEVEAKTVASFGGSGDLEPEKAINKGHEFVWKFPKTNLDNNKNLINANAVFISIDAQKKPSRVGRVSVEFPGETVVSPDGRLMVLWPRSQSVVLLNSVVDLTIPKGNKMLIVGNSGKPIKGASVTVFYDSSKRKEKYVSDDTGGVVLADSAVEKMLGIVVVFPSKLKVILYDKLQWNDGVVVIEPTWKSGQPKSGEGK